MPRHLFRFALQQFLNGDGGGGGGGAGDPVTPPATPPVAGPTQADIDRLNGALTSERSLNAEIKRLAADKGVSVADLVASLGKPADDKKPEDDNDPVAAQLKAMQEQIASLTKDTETKTKEAQQALVEAALTTAATSAKARSAAAVVAMLRGSIELDDQGKPKGVAEAIEGLKKSEPGLFNVGGRLDGGRPPRDAKDVKPGMDRLSEAYATDSTTASNR